MPHHNRTLRETYHPYLRKFMSWKDGVDYAEGFQFSDAQMVEIRPSHIVRYMSLLAYGNEHPADNDRPIRRCGSGLEFIKKAISFFMPNQNAK